VKLYRSRLLLPCVVLLTAILSGGLAAGAEAAASVHWGKANLIEPPRNGGFGGVSCPASNLCVAVDSAGYLVTSTNPSGGVKAWSGTVPIDKGQMMTGVSCPTTSLCVAVDADGQVVTSVKPTGGAAAWSKPVRVDSTTSAGGGPAGLWGISCPTVTLCVAVDGNDPASVVTSTNPAGGARAWRVSALSGALTSVSCSSATDCVVAGTQHWYSTNPDGGAGAWHATGPQVGGGTLSAIDCPAATLCLGVGFGNTSSGLATGTSAPHGAATGWITTQLEPLPPIGGSGLLDGVGCMGTSICIAVDSTDSVFTTTAPVRGVWSGISEIAPASAATVTGSTIACASTVCVVVDSNGYAIAGTLHG
jgi:hypothetical protein